MYIKNQVEFKATASALRRELKNAFPQAPSHAAVLELLAKALGASSYAELNAKLPKESKAANPAEGSEGAPAVPRYPLKNIDGRYDLVVAGEEAMAVRGWGFDTLTGTSESILECTTEVTSVKRVYLGGLVIEHGGDGTEINWEGQETDKDAHGQEIWVCESGDKVTSPFLVLVPQDSCYEIADGGEVGDLPIRENLVQEYVLLARDLEKVDVLVKELESTKKQKCFESIETTLRFSLHALEKVRLLEALRA